MSESVQITSHSSCTIYCIRKTLRVNITHPLRIFFRQQIRFVLPYFSTTGLLPLLYQCSHLICLSNINPAAAATPLYIKHQCYSNLGISSNPVIHSVRAYYADLSHLSLENICIRDSDLDSHDKLIIASFE